MTSFLAWEESEREIDKWIHAQTILEYDMYIVHTTHNTPIHTVTDIDNRKIISTNIFLDLYFRSVDLERQTGCDTHRFDYICAFFLLYSKWMEPFFFHLFWTSNFIRFVILWWRADSIKNPIIIRLLLWCRLVWRKKDKNESSSNKFQFVFVHLFHLQINSKLMISWTKNGTNQPWKSDMKYIGVAMKCVLILTFQTWPIRAHAFIYWKS